MKEIVYIEKMAYGGNSIGKLPGGKIVFVEGAYPGELVEITILKDKNDYAIAKVDKILETIPERSTPKCPYFKECGGCDFLDLKYDKQLEIKKQVFLEQLLRISGLNIKNVEIERSNFEYNYRLKMEFSVTRNKKLGFKRKKSNRVVEIKKCLIAPKPMNQVLDVLPEILDAFNVSVYNGRNGVLKNIVLRYSPRGELMVVFVTKMENFKDAKKIANVLSKQVSLITSVVHVMNSNDKVVLRGPYRILKGEGVISYEFSWEKFQVPPTAFFQNNFYVTEKMIDYLTKNLDLNGNEVVLDLFSGLGTFSIRLALLSKFVVAVGSNHVSVKAGRANANINGLRNIKFIESDAYEFLKNSEKNFDVLVVDPPRSGLGKEMCNEILLRKPEKIAYVSCNPSTFSRDLKMLMELYEIKSIKLFDMFPQTYHIESIAILARK
ncbi:RNA methyltransferase [Thermosipho melanesiensis]|uniref:RNA methyltransferase, TrmA family n=2 Tax=Thermosipho melanesiensis TaxID=46541 RepID=A6LN88_THEM4|nr:23S rRNA (uracil(1939)-C(5))-methyltransferase RlmD [Thermosipho melanesiensis]ABR31389.1 RNA methyltransferase, TrmA family [Thermosipho melanesiensis BI429]APT74449.1 RNA methyltransferase [Thermosipho melanesiensis]OOC36410.1 RNA methyltransferase [Thermosipho melanesiensis]OOC37228.1 RNA methyltransferase [Thermosipho melanesiensis]OOC37980.1 RNA methyltransferase [Thermosipho melanesiensis]